MADENRPADRLPRIAAALEVSVDDLHGDKTLGSDMLYLIRIFSEIDDPAHRKAVIDLARLHSRVK